MEPQAIHRAVRDAFRDVLSNPSLRAEALTGALDEAGARFGVEPYRTCLVLLMLKPRPEPEARDLIESIERHRGELRQRLERDPGFMVAASDLAHAAGGAGRLGASGEAQRPVWSMPATFDERLERELRRSARSGLAVSLIVLSPDVARGLDDDASVSAESVVREATRDVDWVTRLLPDGLAVLLPCTAGVDGLRAAARLRSLVSGASGTAWSAGIASAPDRARSAEVFAAGALAALEQARREGGGTVCGMGQERRRGRRRQVGHTLDGWVDAGIVRWPATLVDLSPCGASLRLPEELALGTRLLLGLRETGARARAAEIPARVVRVTRGAVGGKGASWDTGLDFVAAAGERLQVVDLLAVMSGRRHRGADA